MVTPRSSYYLLLLLVSNFRRTLKQKYHLSGRPTSRDLSSNPSLFVVPVVSLWFELSFQVYTPTSYSGANSRFRRIIGF